MSHVDRRSFLRSAALYGGGALFAPSLAGLAACGGGLILCEDGGGEQYLRGLTQRGEIFDLALNRDNDSEFAGACFSPDGRFLL